MFVVFLARFGMKSLWELIMHKNDNTSSLLVGGVACFKACTFSGSGVMPFSLMIIPNQGMLVLLMMHLSRFNVIPDFSIV